MDSCHLHILRPHAVVAALEKEKKRWEDLGGRVVEPRYGEAAAESCAAGPDGTAKGAPWMTCTPICSALKVGRTVRPIPRLGLGPRLLGQLGK